MTPAQRKLVDDNMKLAYWLVRKYLRRNRRLIRHKDDLNQEAIEGLCLAAKDYKPNGCAFTTFAYARVLWRLHNYASRAQNIVARVGTDFKQKVIRAHGDPLEMMEAWPSPAPSPETVAINRDLSARLLKTVQRVTQDNLAARDIYLSRVVMDRDLNGRPRQQAGLEAGLPPLGRKHGFSKQRAEQLERQVEAEVRKLGQRLNEEAA